MTLEERKRLAEKLADGISWMLDERYGKDEVFEQLECEMQEYFERAALKGNT